VSALSVPYMLYLSPQAGPAAVRFFEWLAENLPEERYPGTARADEPLSNAGKISRKSPLEELLKQHGLLPPVRNAMSDERGSVSDERDTPSPPAPLPTLDRVPGERGAGALNSWALTDAAGDVAAERRLTGIAPRIASVAREATVTADRSPCSFSRDTSPAPGDRKPTELAQAEWSDKQMALVAGGVAVCAALIGVTVWLAQREQQRKKRKHTHTAAAHQSRPSTAAARRRRHGNYSASNPWES
jgi:hypothetical protein